MKFTRAWLADHLDTDADPGRIADTLTAIGLEVESIADRAKDLARVVIARVIEAKPHPNADKLRVCLVDTGSERVQVVCGAPNARSGMIGAFAPPGTRIPGTGLDLKKGTIRGVESNGMLVSEREMGISDQHEGIIDLPADAPVGANWAKWAGLDDAVFEIKLTPNRPDCLGVRGVARDLAAAGLGRLKPLEIKPIAGAYDSPIAVRLDFPAGEGKACPLFVGRMIRGVRNGPSPAWLRDRLTAIGLRPISTLVDMTNYVTFDLGRPLHVFDADKVKGDIVARFGRSGESFLALNGKTYAVEPDMTAICDDSGALGLGGIMGGQSTGCTADTKTVFVEAALFDPLRTAATGRRHGIQSDARYRFERGVDPAFVAAGMEWATRLTMQLCGGEPSNLVVAGQAPDWTRAYALRPDRVATLGGIDLPEAEQRRILVALGFAAKPGGWQPPSWRPDILGEADLVEEIARIAGFERIPALPMPRELDRHRPGVSPAQRRVRIVKRALAERGLTEAITYSFVARAHARVFGGGGDDLMLQNPMSSELDCMRPSLLPGLIDAMRRNVDRGLGDGALFEVGPQYASATLVTGQTVAASGIRLGQAQRAGWTGPARPADAFDAKADALAALAALGLGESAIGIEAGAAAWYHPGRSGTLKLGPKTVLGWFGELHPEVLERFDLAGPLVGFELVLDALPPAKARPGRARPAFAPPQYPAVERDFAFVVDRAVTADRLVKAARQADKKLIEQAGVFDVYAGQGVAEGKVSIALRVRLQPTERTLTEAEIEAVAARVVEAVAKATGATLRT
ncbi:MAG: phenylalanine--tRNA ligase subunit beta [Alphaproteobacteria bacterium]|nr:phenylalanine--tRNA ligase subunit beta [Alphaproteobacteria bacterium]